MTHTGLFLLAVEVTSECNLACPHCYGSFDRRGHAMDPSRVASIADQATDMGVRVVTITGGEPLVLGDQLPEYLAPFTNRGFRLFLTTNGVGIGTTIGKDHLRGLDAVQVSIDGGRQTHDGVRGIGRFDDAVDALRVLRSWDIETAAMMTVHAGNVDDVPEVLGLCQEVGARLSLERYSAPGRTENVVSATPDQLQGVYQLAQSAGLHSFDPCFSAFGYWHRGELPSGGRPVQGGCSAGVAALAITADLDVLTCVRLRESIGNLQHSDLASIWADGPLLRKLRNRGLLEGACGDCGLSPVCGGCRAHAYATTGRLMAADPDCPIPLASPTVRR